MEETLRQLHLERLARRGVVIEESKVEDKMEETKEDPVVEEVEEETCSVCLSPMETKHTLQCGHVICGDCPAMMMTQNLGNGCVGLHAEAGIKVIKCPICRKEDMPTREELIAELVRIRRGGHFSRLAPAPVPRAVPVPQNHNLPAVIPVLQPVVQHNQGVQGIGAVAHLMNGMMNAPPAPAYIHHMNQHWNRDQPAPAIHPPLQANGNWLRNRHYQPLIGENRQLNHWQQYHPIHFNGDNLDRWNIMRGHPIQDMLEVHQFLQAGQFRNGGMVCGQGATRRFYHQQFFVPDYTEGNVPARRLCSNNGTCATQQRSRTARRCSRECGQFICQGCGVCNNERCADHN